MTTQAVVAITQKDLVEYVPFGAEDKIRLTIQIVKTMIAVPSKSGKLPSDTDCIKFQALCRSRKLNPFEGDAFLLGYDSQDGTKWSLITAHQCFLKRAECNPEYDGMKSGVIVQNEDGTTQEMEGDFYLDGQKVIGGWATVFFKTRKVPMTKRVRLSSFNKGFGRWREDPGGMICKCAEADALRSSFPTMLGGLYLREETEVHVGPPAIGKAKVALPAPSFLEAPEPEAGSNLSSQPAPPVAQEPPLTPTATDQPPVSDATNTGEGEASAASAAPSPASPPPTPIHGVKEELAGIIISGGWNFDQFHQWLHREYKVVSDYDSFDMLPQKLAVDLLKSRKGLVASMGRMFPQEAK